MVTYGIMALLQVVASVFVAIYGFNVSCVVVYKSSSAAILLKGVWKQVDVVLLLKTRFPVNSPRIMF